MERRGSKRERRWERAYVQVSTGFTQQTGRITTHLREGDNWTELSALFIAGAKVQMSHSRQAETLRGTPREEYKRYFRKEKNWERK